MSNPSFTSREIRAGSAARTAEQQAKASAAGVRAPGPRFGVKAGSSARDAEDRARAQPTARAGGTSFTLRAQGGRVDRQPPPIAPLPTPPTVEQPTLGTPPDTFSPGLLQTAAAQLKSRIRAFFRTGASS